MIFLTLVSGEYKYLLLDYNLNVVKKVFPLPKQPLFTRLLSASSKLCVNAVMDNYLVSGNVKKKILNFYKIMPDNDLKLIKTRGIN